MNETNQQYVERIARADFDIGEICPVSMYREMRRTVKIRFTTPSGNRITVTYLRKEIQLPSPTTEP